MKSIIKCSHPTVSEITEILGFMALNVLRFVSRCSTSSTSRLLIFVGRVSQIHTGPLIEPDC